jgi:transcription initiation factor TFIIIB Brf1 subunit/transcription initiation factor TFIIB
MQWRYSDVCSECGGKTIVGEAEQVCVSCGVSQPAPSMSPTWSEGRHCTASGSLGSILKGAPNDRKLEILLKKGNAIGYDDTSRKCMQLIRHVCSAENVPSYVEQQAIDIAKKVCQVKPAATPVIAAYCLVYASRMSGYNGLRTRKLMEIVSNLGHRISWHAIVQMALAYPLPAKSTNISWYISMAVSRLRSTDNTAEPTYWRELEELANAVSTIITQFKEGSDPASIASMCVYISEVLLANRDGRRRRLSQERVAAAIGVTVYAMRERFALIFSLKREELEVLAAKTTNCQVTSIPRLKPVGFPTLLVKSTCGHSLCAHHRRG